MDHSMHYKVGRGVRIYLTPDTTGKLIVEESGLLVLHLLNQRLADYEQRGKQSRANIWEKQIFCTILPYSVPHQAVIHPENCRLIHIASLQERDTA